MKKAILLALVALAVLLGAPASANRACRTVESRSFYQIKCSYDYETSTWTLRYKGPAYRMTKKSGRHAEMIDYLCSYRGARVQEKHNRKVTYHDCI
jgi:hypothetical protein